MNRFIINFVVAASCALTLTACHNSMTYSPKATQAELEQERMEHERVARSAREQSASPITLNRQSIMQRVNDVGARTQQAAHQQCIEMFGQQHKCAFNIEVANKGGLNAYANGEKVVIFPEMVAFTHNDSELGLILAHEMAHNIMMHPQGQQQNTAIGGILGTLGDALAASQGINTGGALSQLGAQRALLRYSSKFEREADYVGLYILARAGYDVAAAPEFWRRMSVANPDGIYTSTTHPTNPERYVNLKKTIAEIQSKQANGQPLIPMMKKG
ncbi:MAG: hypothetical protein EAY65_05690 [Alphaproteobacteria bacterium]|nr:MAG: hypothetical protein EAY65_05690 [Alphaproteobacteria bacterium]